MTGLWADGWFYISSAGLLISGVMFFFLLGQYRAAAEAADHLEPEVEVHAEPEPIALPVRPISRPEAQAPVAHVAPIEVSPVALAAEPPPERRRETITGGISPAVVYLQNIKVQLDELRGETRELSQRVGAISGRDEALIERLSELAKAVSELKLAAPVAAPTPVVTPAVAVAPETVEEPVAPKRVKKEYPPPGVVKTIRIEPALAAALAPAPAPVSVPVVEPAPETPAAAPEPAAAVPEPVATVMAPPVEAPEPVAEKPRRGPVWPV